MNEGNKFRVPLDDDVCEKRMYESFNRVGKDVLKIVTEMGYTFTKGTTLGLMKGFSKTTMGHVITERRNGKNIRKLEMSRVLLSFGSDSDIDDVMAHEMLHCVEEATGHGKVWQEMAKEVSLRMGLNIQTYANDLVDGNEILNDNIQRDYKYKLICKRCFKESLHLGSERIPTKLTQRNIKCSDCHSQQFVLEESSIDHVGGWVKLLEN